MNNVIVRNYKDDDLNAVNTDAQNQINAIDTALITHQQGIYANQNTARGREMEQSHDVVRNHQNNNSGNNNHGGNNNG